jgi:hypothetical protein
VDRYAECHPGTEDRSDAAIAREMLKMVRWSIERHGGPESADGGGLDARGTKRVDALGCEKKQVTRIRT